MWLLSFVCVLSISLSVYVCCQCCCRRCCVLCVVVDYCVMLFVGVVGLCSLLMCAVVLHGVACCVLFDGCWLMAMV